MSYPLINGAAINGEDGGLQLDGIELPLVGAATALHYLVAGGYSPLEPGAPSVQFTLVAQGLDLVASGTHTGLFNAMLQPTGIDSVVSGTADVFLVAQANGAPCLDLGSHRAQIGVDQALYVDGRDLVRHDIHSALAGQPAPNVVADAASYWPLEFGAPSASRTGNEVDAASAQPLEIGMPGLSVTLAAAGSWALELGGASAAFAFQALSTLPMECGDPSASFWLTPGGVDLARAGTHSAAQGSHVATAAGAHVMEFGTPGAPRFTAYARQVFPLQVGTPTISRGLTC